MSCVRFGACWLLTCGTRLPPRRIRGNSRRSIATWGARRGSLRYRCALLLGSVLSRETAGHLVREPWRNHHRLDQVHERRHHNPQESKMTSRHGNPGSGDKQCPTEIPAFGSGEGQARSFRREPRGRCRRCPSPKFSLCPGKLRNHPHRRAACHPEDPHALRDRPRKPWIAPAGEISRPWSVRESSRRIAGYP
jgi:hypothetical protein